MKVKTSDLIGPALDWAVAKIEGECVPEFFNGSVWITTGGFFSRVRRNVFEPTTNWKQGGPLIEREEIDIYCYESPKSGCGWWVAEITGTKAKAKGNTPLIAAMCCFVASRLGDEVEIPEELCECIQNSL